MPNLLALTFFHSGPSKPSAPGPPAQNAHGPHPVSGAKQTLGVTNHSISPLPPSHQPQRRRGRLTRGYGGGGRGGGVGGRGRGGRGRRAAAAAARGGERRERARGEAAGPGERAQPPQLRGAQGHRDRDGGGGEARTRAAPEVDSERELTAEAAANMRSPPPNSFGVASANRLLEAHGLGWGFG